MLGKLYIVKNGDTLWDIATKQLGNPLRWPEIYEHNNSQTVIINTGIKISDPNLIFVGQKIYIPETQNPAKAPVITHPVKNVPNAGKVRAMQKVYSIPFKYSLETLPPITMGVVPLLRYTKITTLGE